VWVSRVRRKLGAKPGEPGRIKTFQGIGYPLDAGPARSGYGHTSTPSNAGQARNAPARATSPDQCREDPAHQERTAKPGSSGPPGTNKRPEEGGPGRLCFRGRPVIGVSPVSQQSGMPMPTVGRRA